MAHGIEHHHISLLMPKLSKCIDLYLDHDAGLVRISDTLNRQNAMTISGDDWNELIERIRGGIIGKVAAK